MSVFDWQPRALHIEGGAIVPPANAHHSPRGYRRIYLLVHGFNNTPAQANDAYSGLKSRLRQYVGPHSMKKIWEFYWPGYEENFRGVLSLRTGPKPANSLVTAYYYYKQIPKAIRLGKLLGEYILQLQSDTQETEVILIGHSLGCRLILEAMGHIEGKTSRSKVPAILLMAAAVPVSAVELGGSLRAAVEFCPTRFVLYSHRDWILWGCFPAGQLLGKDGGAFPQAVGWKGAPDACWSGRQRTNLFHGEYWRDDSTTPNVVRLFGKATAHVLPYSTIVPWRLRDPPELPAWKLPKRGIRG